jgi:hypothetical protein
MKKSSIASPLLKVGYAFFHAFSMMSGVALGESFVETPLASAEASAESASDAAPSLPSEEKASSSVSFVSEGHVYDLKELGIKLTPPKGWEVAAGSNGLSLVIKEPRDPAPAYDAPKYQRNITMAVIHSPSPIDEKRAQELEAQLVKNFTQEGSSQDFKIVEHKFFNYKGDGDGLLVYSNSTVNGYPMMQMHVLLGSNKKQFLFTYTDLASRFASDNTGAYQLAWSTIVGSEIDGTVPSRLSTYRPYFFAGGFMTFLFALLGFIRWRALRKDYKAEADFMIDSEDGSLKASDGSQVTALRHTSPKSRKLSVQETLYSGFSSFSSLTVAPVSAHSTGFTSNFKSRI